MSLPELFRRADELQEAMQNSPNSTHWDLKMVAIVRELIMLLQQARLQYGASPEFCQCEYDYTDGGQICENCGKRRFNL